MSSAALYNLVVFFAQVVWLAVVVVVGSFVSLVLAAAVHTLLHTLSFTPCPVMRFPEITVSNLTIAMCIHTLTHAHTSAAARMCTFAETRCGGFEASAASGFLHAWLANAGTLAAAYTVVVTECRWVVG